MAEASISQLFQQAARLQQSGRLAEAEELCSRILQSQPDNPEALHMRGMLAWQKGQGELAVDLLRQAIARKTDNPHAHCNLAMILQNTGKLPEAIASYRRAVELDPRSLRAQGNLGALLAQSGQKEEAITALERAVTIEPKFAFGHYNLANIFRDQGKLDEAIAAYRRAITVQGSFASAHFSLGNALCQKGLTEEGIVALRQAVKLDPSHAASYSNLGFALEMVDQFDQAIDVYEQGIAARPDAIECYCGLGHALTKKGQLPRAAEVYRQAMALDPNSVVAQRGLANALELQGDIAGAISMFKAVREKSVSRDNYDYVLAALGEGQAPPASPAEYVAGLFNEYADRFDKHLRQLNYTAPQLLFDLIAALDDRPMDIIDLGCGTGMCGTLFRPKARRLVGIDLAPRMIEKARQRAVYDELQAEDITDALEQRPKQFDLALAADVFVYVGNLERVFAAAARALRAGGLLAFTIESVDSGDYVLRSSRRYAQSMEYVRRLASGSGFCEIKTQDIVVRTEDHMPIDGKIVILKLEAPPATS